MILKLSISPTSASLSVVVGWAIANSTLSLMAVASQSDSTTSLNFTYGVTRTVDSTIML